MPGKPIGELNGWRGWWLQVVTGILVPLILVLLLPAGWWVASTLVRIEEQTKSRDRRIAENSAVNVEQWRTMNVIQGAINGHEVRISGNTKEIDRIRDGKGS